MDEPIADERSATPESQVPDNAPCLSANRDLEQFDQRSPASWLRSVGGSAARCRVSVASLTLGGGGAAAAWLTGSDVSFALGVGILTAIGTVAFVLAVAGVIILTAARSIHPTRQRASTQVLHMVGMFVTANAQHAPHLLVPLPVPTTPPLPAPPVPSTDRGSASLPPRLLHPPTKHRRTSVVAGRRPRRRRRVVAG